MSRCQEIDEFIKKHSESNFNGVSVKDLRHFIPLFLIEVYVELFGRYSKKGECYYECSVVCVCMLKTLNDFVT